LDYLNSPFETLKELKRICKNSAKIKIWCGYWNCKGSYNTLYHTRGFSEECFSGNKNQFGNSESLGFKTEKLELIPTKMGRLIYPKLLRNFLAKFIGGIIGQLHIELKVVK